MSYELKCKFANEVGWKHYSIDRNDTSRAEISQVGCDSVMKSEIPFAKDAAYTCKRHHKAIKTARFQSTQFDKGLQRSNGGYDGNQPSTVVKFEESLEKFGQSIDLK